MDEYDFSKIGRDILDSVQDVVDMVRSAVNTSKGPAPVLWGEVGGKFSGMAMALFGGMGCAGFGMPACLLLAAGAALGSAVLAMLAIMVFAPLTVVSGILLRKGCVSIGRVKRFDKYKRCVGDKKLCAIRRLGDAVNKDERFVRRELEMLIAQGSIPQGHIDDERTCLIMDDETYHMYLKSKEQVRRAADTKNHDAGTGSKEQEGFKSTVTGGTGGRHAAGESFGADSKPHPKADAGNFKGFGEAPQKNAAGDTPELKEALEVGMGYIRQIRQINDELPQPVISEKLTHLEQVIGLIYLRVQKVPEQLNSIKKFTDYYLPATLRLVVAYRDFDRVGTENARESMEQIEQTLDMVNTAFDKLLDGLYEEDRMNIQADISVLKTLLAQEGLTDDGLFGGGL